MKRGRITGGLILLALAALATWGYATGTGGGSASFDLQKVPMFRDCGKSGADYTTADNVVLETCSWRVVGTETVKTAGAGLTAKGRFLLVRLQLKNLGASAATLTGVEVELIDINNISKIYDPEENKAVLDALGRPDLLSGTVQAGQTAEGWVAFDVSPTAKNFKLRVRDIDLTKSAAASIDLKI